MSGKLSQDRAASATLQWHRECPELDPLPMEIMGRLLELSQRISRERINPLFGRFRLQSGEFDVLATLYRSGAPYTLTPTALYETMMITSGGMTSRLDRLESAGHIERRKNPSDRRGSLVVLTPGGKELMDEILPLHVENERMVLAPLSAAEQKTFNKLLHRLLEGL